jgi:hypothetical protein
VLRLTENGNLPIAPPPKSVGKVLANLQYLQPSVLFGMLYFHFYFKSYLYFCVKFIVNFTIINNFIDAFSDLAQRHHSVSRVRVTGIPMRETVADAVRNLHEAVLLFDSTSLSNQSGK